MIRCLFCQAELPAGARFCRHCGRLQPADAPGAPPASASGAVGLRCPKCRQPLLPDDRFCRQCGQTLTLRCPSCGEFALETDRFCARCAHPLGQPAEQAATSGALTGRCPHCGESLPATARFCANCGRSLSGAIGAPDLLPGVSRVPGAPAGPQSGAFGVPSAPVGPQSGMPGVPSAPAGPQSGLPGVPSAPAGPQSGALHVPGASAGPQAGAPGVPSAPAWQQSGLPGITSAPAWPQSGALSVPHAPAGPSGGMPSIPSASAAPQAGAPQSSPMHIPSAPASPPGGSLPGQAGSVGRVAGRAASKAVGRSVGSKLLGTAACKVIASVLAVVVVATGGTAAAVAIGHNPVATAFQQITGHTGSGGAGRNPTPTPLPPPPEVTYIGSDGNVWDMTLPNGTSRQLTNDAQANNNISYFGLAWSPDGKKLAVVRSSGSQDSATNELRILSPTGGVLLHVSLPGGPDNRPFVWSPDGRLIAYRTGAARSNAAGDQFDTLYLFDAQTGRIVKQVTFDRGPTGCGTGPAPLSDAIWNLHHAFEGIDTFSWSPDQQKMLIAYGCSNYRSAQLDLTSGNVTPGYPEGASYQPDGNQILGADIPSGSLELLDASGNPVRTLASGSGQAVWSNDGQSVYYEHNNGIWQVSVDGSNAHLIVAGAPPDSQGNETDDVVPQPSPDGKMLLYVQVHGTDRDPSNTVNGQWYIAQVDGTNPAPLPQVSFQFNENSTYGFTGVWEMVWRAGT